MLVTDDHKVKGLEQNKKKKIVCQKIANAKFRAYRKLIGVCYLGQIERRIIYDSGSEQFAVALVTNVCYRRGLLERDAKQVPLSLLAETLEISTGALPRGSLSRTGNRVRHNYSLSRSISACVRETASASPVITKRNVSGSDKLPFIRSCSVRLMYKQIRKSFWKIYKRYFTPPG